MAVAVDRSRTVLRAVLGTARLLVAAAVVALLAGPAVLTWVSGMQFVVVDGGSMEPAYTYGDVILVAPPTGEDLVPGAVVTVRQKNGALYTHRVISVDNGQAITQGDANSTPDTDPVLQADVFGAVAVHIGGPAAKLLQLTGTAPARISLVAIIIGLFLPGLPARTQAASTTDRSATDRRAKGRRAKGRPERGRPGSAGDAVLKDFFECEATERTRA